MGLIWTVPLSRLQKDNTARSKINSRYSHVHAYDVVWAEKAMADLRDGGTRPLRQSNHRVNN